MQGTRGAELAAGLNRDRITNIFQKGTDAGIDSYSGLFDNGHHKSTGMGEWLKAQRVTEVFVCGLATDYCVKFTALDAAKMAFKTHLIADASRGVNLLPDDAKNAIEEMKLWHASSTARHLVGRRRAHPLHRGQSGKL